MNRHDGIQLIQHLIKKGLPYDTAANDSILMLAIETRSLEFARVMVEKGADVDVDKGNGFTGLMMAVLRGGNYKTVQYLIEAGADVTAEDPQGDTALTLAGKLRDKKAALMLVKASSNTDAKKFMLALDMTFRCKRSESPYGRPCFICG